MRNFREGLKRDVFDTCSYVRGGRGARGRGARGRGGRGAWGPWGPGGRGDRPFAGINRYQKRY